MTVKRCVLLIMGLVWSILVISVLCVFADSMLSGDAAYFVDRQPQSSTAADTNLPILVPGTTLQIQRISSYEGPFVEDGSDREVVNVAALHVCNTGSGEIAKACITLQQGNNCYVFYGEHFLPGVTVVLLEQNAGSYQQGAVTDCTGWQEDTADKKRTDVLVTDRSMGTVIVTNLGDRALQNVCVYYKSWLSPPDVYVGGISYKVQIPMLLPGQTEYLYPSHYAAGYSKVVWVSADP